MNSFYRFAIPEDLTAYYRVSNIIKIDVERNSEFRSDIIICRGTGGTVSSVKYYTPDGELYKEVNFEGSDISEAYIYRNKILYSKEKYMNGRVYSKSLYKSDNTIAYTYMYEYNKRGNIISICKKINGKEILSVYKYDDFSRITKRKIFLNNEIILEQHYGYDILDRITTYTDDNQRIVVNKLSKNNELLSYVITDKIGNNIRVENIFNGQEYIHTKINVNGHCSTIKDTSYVDNVMLKKPYTTEDDLDLIIANLYGCNDSMRTTREDTMIKNSLNMIDKNIEIRTIPISLRKRLLYNNITNIVKLK